MNESNLFEFYKSILATQEQSIFKTYSKVDYQELLIKYIMFILEQESISFLDRISESAIYFSSHELEALETALRDALRIFKLINDTSQPNTP